jgi:excisionase family DNA binding protein
MKEKAVDRIGYRPKEVAQMLGIGESTMLRLIRDGAFSVVRVGSIIIITADALKAFLAAHEVRQ